MTEQPTVLADADARAEWLEQRRQGITATEVAKAATGRPADRRSILTEKVTNETREFDNKYLAWGRTREPFIADWITRNYGIEPNRYLLAHPVNPRYLATPDGYSVQFDGSVATAEVKTSKHDLDPVITASTVTADDANKVLAGKVSGGQFWSETYYDQMQWQMFVTGAERALFVWEQHDDRWPNPTPMGAPRAVWVERNNERIAYLVSVADVMLVEIDAARGGSLPWDQGDVPTPLVDPVHRLLEARVAESTAKAARETVWVEVQELVKALPAREGEYENHEAKVTYSTTFVIESEAYDLSTATATQRTAHEKRVAAMERASERVARAEAALARATETWEAARTAFTEKGAQWREVTEVPSGRRVTVTGKKQKAEK